MGWVCGFVEGSLIHAWRFSVDAWSTAYSASGFPAARADSDSPRSDYPMSLDGHSRITAGHADAQLDLSCGRGFDQAAQPAIAFKRQLDLAANRAE